MKSYVINLHDRLDRWEVVSQHLVDCGFDIQRYVGQRIRPGYKGCTASHLGALAAAGNAPFIVFEDDAQVIGDTDIMMDAITELGEFDMLFLGCLPQEVMKKHTDHTVRIGRVYQTHAIVYGSDRVVDYILSNRHSIVKIDVFISEYVIPKFNCYATNPIICQQRESYSDITRMIVTHDEIVDQFNSMIE